MGRSEIMHISIHGNRIANRIRLADTFWSRFIGLQGKHGLGEGEGLLIRPCRQIHTFRLQFKIDILFLTKSGTVVHLIQSMGRNRISPFVRDGFAVLEMDQGVIDRYGIAVGDTLTME